MGRAVLLSPQVARPGKGSPMSKLIVAALVFACFAVEAPAAAAKNNPSVTGGFTSRMGAGIVVRIRTVQINVVQHKNGKLTGKIKTTERVYNNGVLSDETTVNAKADELIISGSRAYIRAGGFYFVVVDNGEGSKAAPDKSFALVLVGTPLLATQIPALNFLVDFIGAETIKGNAQVRE